MNLKGKRREFFVKKPITISTIHHVSDKPKDVGVDSEGLDHNGNILGNDPEAAIALHHHLFFSVSLVFVLVLEIGKSIVQDNPVCFYANIC